MKAARRTGRATSNKFVRALATASSPGIVKTLEHLGSFLVVFFAFEREFESGERMKIQPHGPNNLIPRFPKKCLESVHGITWVASQDGLRVPRELSIAIYRKSTVELPSYDVARVRFIEKLFAVFEQVDVLDTRFDDGIPTRLTCPPVAPEVEVGADGLVAVL